MRRWSTRGLGASFASAALRPQATQAVGERSGEDASESEDASSRRLLRATRAKDRHGRGAPEQQQRGGERS
jgi:hypothetical protein